MQSENITYRQLLESLQKLDDEKLDQTVTINLTGMSEYFPLAGYTITDGDDGVLDPGHFLLVVDN